MKLKYLIICFIFANSLISYGQSTKKKKLLNTHDGDFVYDASIFYTKFLAKNSYGWNLDIKSYVFKRIITGLTLNQSFSSLDSPFIYKSDTVVKPNLEFYSLGWINEYSLVKRDLFRVNLTLNNAIALSSLQDLSKRSVRVNHTSSRAPTIALDVFYIVEPGINIWIGLSKKYPIYLTLKSKYRFVSGVSKINSTSNFSNYNFGIGLTAALKKFY